MKGAPARFITAQETFRSGYNCAQSIITAFADYCDADTKTARALAAGFGAGFGRLQMTCGAATGAIMVIGASLHDEKDVASSKILVYERTREFLARFEGLIGHTRCRDIIGVDLLTDEGMAQARENGLFQSRCEPCLEAACAILESIL